MAEKGKLAKDVTQINANIDDQDWTFNPKELANYKFEYCAKIFSLNFSVNLFLTMIHTLGTRGIKSFPEIIARCCLKINFPASQCPAITIIENKNS